MDVHPGKLIKMTPPRRKGSAPPVYTDITLLVESEAESIHLNGSSTDSQKPVTNGVQSSQSEPKIPIPLRRKPRINAELSKNPLFKPSSLEDSCTPPKKQSPKASGPFSRNFKSFSFKNPQLKTLVEEGGGGGSVDTENPQKPHSRGIYRVLDLRSPKLSPRSLILSRRKRSLMLQNDLISGLPTGGAKGSRPKLDVLSHCPPPELDDIDGIDYVMACR